MKTILVIATLVMSPGFLLSEPAAAARQLEARESLGDERAAEKSGASEIESIGSNPKSAEAANAAMSGTMKRLARARLQTKQAAPPHPGNTLLIVLWSFWLILALVGFLVLVPKMVRQIKSFLSRKIPVPAGAAEIMKEEQTFSDFAKQILAGPCSLEAKTATGGISPSHEGNLAPPPQASTRETPRDEFFATVTKEIPALKTKLSEISGIAEPSERRIPLEEMARELQRIKARAGILDLVCIWKLAASLEGLLKQISEEEGNATPSALRTVKDALALLGKLSSSRLDPDIATKSPAKILVVDDDVITRHAITNVLKKALGAPDLAPSGEAGVTFIEAKDYDVIFLDVEMPGMDGYELCSKIQKGTRNRTTPVVFVTAHNDYQARARAIDVGGHDLIAKPFLAFELTVKALTLVIRARIGHLAGGECAITLNPSASTAPSDSQSAPRGHVTDLPASSRQDFRECPPVTEGVNRLAEVTEHVAAASVTSESDSTKFFPTLFELGNKRVAGMRSKLAELESAGVQRRADLLGELYIEADSLPSEKHPAITPSISRLIVAMKNMVKKLIENNDRLNRSAMDTAAAALGVLSDICETQRCPDLSAPPISVLVTDDDPVARRTMVCALQLQFGKPETAESGQRAVELAQQKKFDVIFMDVCMPGMDGFEACLKIRQTDLNRETPIVFVTSHTDQETRDRAARCEGSGFIAKGFLPAEIILMTLAFSLHGRMQPSLDSKLVTA
jgi:CheY-like chemotaxis protein